MIVSWIGMCAFCKGRNLAWIGNAEVCWLSRHGFRGDLLQRLGRLLFIFFHISSLLYWAIVLFLR